MPRNEDPVSVLRALIDAMNRGEHDAGLTSMTEDVVIIDDVPPFRRAGRREAKRWFERLSVARARVKASLTVENAEVRVAGDTAYVVAPGLYRGTVDGARVDVKGTLTATLGRRDGTWRVDGLVWGCEI
jgi:ketosteroid isomerase-like protein